MFKTLIRVGGAAFAVALVAGLAGTVGTARAADPGLNLDFSGLKGLSTAGGPADDWSKVADQLQPKAAAPASPIEPAAKTTAGTTSSAPATASIPQTSPAPATLQLPSAGTGSASGSGMALLAIIVAAAAGVACLGAARAVRAVGVRA
jgi:hypothetical protein